jgi:hypothetical protein
MAIDKGDCAIATMLLEQPSTDLNARNVTVLSHHALFARINDDLHCTELN